MEACKCLDVLGVWYALKCIIDEVVEFVREPSRDELSDICWGVGRLVGALLGKVYVRVPGDRLHYEKVMSRYEEYGCVRSRRFLVDGSCPS